MWRSSLLSVAAFFIADAVLLAASEIFSPTRFPKRWTQFIKLGEGEEEASWVDGCISELASFEVETVFHGISTQKD